MDNATRADRLQELSEEMDDILFQMKDLLRGSEVWEAARSYWFAHIQTAMSRNSEYLGSSMITLDDTIEELRELAAEEEEG